jgi:plastocyanin
VRAHFMTARSGLSGRLHPRQQLARQPLARQPLARQPLARRLLAGLLLLVLVLAALPSVALAGSGQGAYSAQPAAGGAMSMPGMTMPSENNGMPGYETLPAGAAQPLPGAEAPTVVVHIRNFSFGSPLTVSPGTTVQWVNDDKMAHTVTADDGTFDSGSLAPGATFTTTFNMAGDYAYYCRFHGGPGGQGMASKVTVSDQAGAAGGQTNPPAAGSSGANSNNATPGYGSTNTPGYGATGTKNKSYANTYSNNKSYGNSYSKSYGYSNNYYGRRYSAPSCAVPYSSRYSSRYSYNSNYRAYGTANRSYYAMPSTRRGY